MSASSISGYWIIDSTSFSNLPVETQRVPCVNAAPEFELKVMESVTVRGEPAAMGIMFINRFKTYFVLAVTRVSFLLMASNIRLIRPLRDCLRSTINRFPRSIISYRTEGDDAAKL